MPAPAGLICSDCQFYALDAELNAICIRYPPATLVVGGHTVTPVFQRVPDVNEWCGEWNRNNMFLTSERGHLYGLTVSMSAVDASNDLVVGVGEATTDDVSDPVLLKLDTAITKQLDATWELGSDRGGLDTGTAADGPYHVYLIGRSDTAVVDVLFSASASSPVLPANYDRKRRIASFMRNAGVIRPFRQDNDQFILHDNWTASDSTTPVTDVLLNLPLPTGIHLTPLLTCEIKLISNGDAFYAVGDGDMDHADVIIGRVINVAAYNIAQSERRMTNLAGQIRYTLVLNAGAIETLHINLSGWVDARGRCKPDGQP